jgi:hypothetical protein
MLLTDCVQSFITDGFSDISEAVSFDSRLCLGLYSSIMQSREFDSIFIDEPDDLTYLKYKGVNPKPDGNNFLLQLNTSFIEQNPTLNKILAEVLGKYNILLKKIICGLPDAFIPNWCIQLVKDKPVPNLGAYIKPQYQDITYFRGIDWHQDIIDYPGRDPRFITLYIYLHDVTEDDAPLWVVPKSHLLGATKFPHNIESLGGQRLKYSDDKSLNSLTLSSQPLIGRIGSCYFWHSNVLHGTTQVNGPFPRISLRYLIERDSDSEIRTAIDVVTQSCLNNAFISITRDDLNDVGQAVKSGNKIKGIL